VRSPPPYTHDLSPPRLISETISQLGQITAVYSSSLVSSADGDQDFAPILAAVVDPIVQSAQLGGGELEPSDSAVYQLNVIASLQAVLRKAEFARSRQETLSLHAANCLDALVHAQASLVLKKCGLADKLSKLQELATRSSEAKRSESVPNDKLAHVPGMDSTSLTATFESFYRFLVSGDLFVMPHCDRLSMPATRRACREAVARVVSSGYMSLCQAISDPSNGYTDVRAILTYSPEQVNTLLELRGPVTPSASGNSPTHKSSLTLQTSSHFRQL